MYTNSRHTSRMLWKALNETCTPSSFLSDYLIFKYFVGNGKAQKRTELRRTLQRQGVSWFDQARS